MNDTQTLVLIHAVAWPILIGLLSKNIELGMTFQLSLKIDDESRPGQFKKRSQLFFILV